MKIVIFLIYFLLFTFFHELGHFLTAKVFGLKIQKIGFQLLPFPIFHISVQPKSSFYIKFFYYFSGIIFVLLTFLFLLIFKFYYNKILLNAILLRIILDLNPFYSDITNLVEKENYKYSTFWYIHFFVWGIIIFLILKNYHNILKLIDY